SVVEVPKSSPQRLQERQIHLSDALSDGTSVAAGAASPPANRPILVTERQRMTPSVVSGARRRPGTTEPGVDRSEHADDGSRVSGVVGARPLLVYNRIDANRRAARLLLAAFGAALLPVASLAAFFVFPLIHLMYFSVSPSLARLGQSTLSALYAGFFLLSLV